MKLCLKIPGYPFLRRGEPTGHCTWVDAVALEQVVEAAGAFPDGLPLTWRHSLTDDGEVPVLGVVRNMRVEGDAVLGDIELDLGGLSLGFVADPEAEAALLQEHADAAGNFTSPDPGNVRNLVHQRIARLDHISFVEEAAS